MRIIAVDFIALAFIKGVEKGYIFRLLLFFHVQYTDREVLTPNHGAQWLKVVSSAKYGSYEIAR